MRFVLFAGKGGVGKTTLSCVTAVRLARDFPEKRVLLFSTDPAHSLSACLQAEIGPRPTVLLPGLTAMEIDAQAEFEKLKTRYAEDLERFLESVSRGFDLTFDRVVLERMMDLAPPGLDEIMALTRIMEFLARDSYDLFVLDCAPTGHLIRLLELPELINEWLKAFFNLFLKYERILRLPGFAEELVGISRNLKKLRELLQNPASLRAVCGEHSHPDGAGGNQGSGGGVRPHGHCRPARVPEPDDAAVRLPLVFGPAAAGTAGGGGVSGRRSRRSSRLWFTDSRRSPGWSSWKNSGGASTSPPDRSWSARDRIVKPHPAKTGSRLNYAHWRRTNEFRSARSSTAC